MRFHLKSSDENGPSWELGRGIHLSFLKKNKKFWQDSNHVLKFLVGIKSKQ